MTLQLKFAVLLALLGLTLSVALGAAWWSFRLLETETAGPFNTAAAILVAIDRVKGDLAAQPPDRAAALDKLADLGSDEHRLARIGAGALRNIVHRVSDEQDDAALALLDRVKSRALADAGLASEHAGRIRARLVTVLALALLAAALTAALALLLLRRWVVRPVAQLRLAAARIGAGDYAHRLPASGQDEIALLSAEVNRMAANIEQLLEERVERERLAATREMLRRIVHNLRNPLAGIRGLAELTRSELSENPDSGELAENQDRIMNAVDRFESWLADILRSTSPLTIIPQPQPVVCWLDRVVETLRPAGDLHALRIEIDHAHAPESAMFDAGHLEHALVAVLTNAIQASPRNSTIAVRATSENGDGAWRIEVADQGEGVPEPLQDRIFRAHFTTKRDGTGIGLAVARQVVRAHGGSIRVENISAAGAAAPAGARFTLRLPLEPPGDTQADDRDSDD